MKAVHLKRIAEQGDFMQSDNSEIENLEYEVGKQVEHQLNMLFTNCGDLRILEEISPVAYKKTNKCISSIRDWTDDGFKWRISWQYATYLYFLSREAYISANDIELAEMLFLLNKSLNSIELFYKVEMPDYFFLSHTVGLVFSNAIYGQYSVFHQGCTVGRSGKDKPNLGNGVVLYPNSGVIGRCTVRDNTVLTPGVFLVNSDTPGDCYVFPGENGKLNFKPISEYHADRFFIRNLK